MKMSQQMADRGASVPCFEESFILQTYACMEILKISTKTTTIIKCAKYSKLHMYVCEYF